MRIEDLLIRLDRPRRQSRGWVARCPVPAHDDHDPSLTIREGDLGLLIKCWAGCSVDEICDALDLKVHNLFYDDGNRDRQIQPKIRKQAQAKKQQRQARDLVKAAQADVLREAVAK